jgi:hypothetical protein
MCTVVVQYLLSCSTVEPTGRIIQHAMRSCGMQVAQADSTSMYLYVVKIGMTKVTASMTKVTVIMTKFMLAVTFGTVSLDFPQYVNLL